MSAWGKSWGFAWGNAWGLLTRPYVDLSSAERVYVRELLSAIYVREDVEQIVSLAATQQISVVDAEQVILVRHIDNTLLIRQMSKRVVDSRPAIKKAKPVPKQLDITARLVQQSIFTKFDHADDVFVTQSADQITLITYADEQVVRHKRS